MNRILTLCLLMLASTNLHAQSLSAGFRASAGYRWPAEDRPTYVEVKYEPVFVAPEVFVRYETKKRWAFEFSYSRSRYDRPDVISQVYDGLYDTVVIRSKGFSSDLMVSVQYEIGNLVVKESASSRKFHHYAGLSTGLYLLRGETAFYPDYAPNTTDMEFEDVENGFWLGANYTLVYNAGKRLKLTSSAYFKASPHNLYLASIYYGISQPSLQVGLQLGAAYRIF